MINKLFKAFFAVIITGIIITACVKEDFDKPPVGSLPVGDVLTISQLRQMYVDSGEYTFTKEYSVYATVTMDGSSGNIYKNAYIQDEGGAINLHLKENGGVRVGDSIRVYLKNCKLSKYSELLQIDNVDNDSNILILANQRYIQPTTVTIPEIKTGNYESYLVKLEDVEFAENELNKTYADPDESANRILENCSFETLIVRTSNYANFAEDNIPDGKGSIIAIVGRYNDDWQLYIRTLDEVKLTGERCQGGGGLEQISIEEVRALYSGSPTTLPAEKKIVGVITSDTEHDNLPGKNAFIQEVDGDGIALRFSDWHDLPMGALVEINISGQELSEYSGLLQINNLPVGNAVQTGTSELPDPVEITIANLLTDYDNYEAKLIKLSDVTISSPGGYETYKWTTELNDGTGTVNMYTYEYASFADDNFPTELVDITGIASYYDDPQISIRNLDDVVLVGGGTGFVIDEDFQDQVSYEDIDIDGWVNEAIEGTRKWIARDYDGNFFAQATSYNGGEANDCWLITKAINLDELTNPKLEFESAIAYWVHDGLTVYISTDFDGSDITSATWEEINCDLAGQQNNNYEWVESGIIDLSGYSGTAYIAFQYTGDDNAGNTTTYRIDNVKVYYE